jgi:MFS family permease
MAGNWAAMSMQMIVRSLLAYRLTDSAALIGVLALALALPTMFVSILGGIAADRMPKKQILLISRVGSVVSALGVGLALNLGFMDKGNPGAVGLLIASAIFDGIISGFSQPALMAIIPELVGKEEVMNAISLSSVGQNIFRLMGPTLAGVIIDQYGFQTVYYIMAGLQVIATFGTLFLPRGEVGRAASSVSPMRNIIEAFQYIRKESIFLLIVLFAIGHMIGGMPYQQLLPVFTESILKVSATKLGVLSSVSGLGALIGTLIMASLPNRKRGAILILSGLIMGVPVIIFSFSHWWYLSLAMMPMLGLAPTLHMAMTTTLIQSYAAPEYRARMQSFFAMAQGVSSFSSFVAGMLAEAIGVQWAVGGMAVFLVLVTVGFWVFSPRLRNLD